LQANSPIPSRDSVQIHRAAQAAQARFERRRLDFLPWYDGPSSDPCDELIGRYCFRYGDRDALYEPPPDSEPLVKIRDQLIAELGHASGVLPGDEWIAGQRIRYLVEAKRVEAGVSAAAACRPSGSWWCLALLGYAHHGAGEYAAAA